MGIPWHGQTRGLRGQTGPPKSSSTPHAAITHVGPTEVGKEGVRVAKRPAAATISELSGIVGRIN